MCACSHPLWRPRRRSSFSGSNKRNILVAVFFICAMGVRVPGILVVDFAWRILGLDHKRGQDVLFTWRRVLDSG